MYTKIISSQQMRNIENKAFNLYKINSYNLMKSAGKAVFEEIIANFGLVTNKKCTVLCGNGNNGGDGFVIAKELLKSKAKVQIIYFNEALNFTSDTTKAFSEVSDINKIFYNINSVKEIIEKSDLIVDAVYGTGYNRQLCEQEIIFFKLVNQSNAYKVAVDVPSGIVCDTGIVLSEAINCDITVTFQFYKYCHFIFPSADFCGKVIVKDIGIPKIAWEDEDLKVNLIDDILINSLIPKRNRNSHKGSFGKALVICGSKLMTGAAYFSVMGALRSGIGLVTLAVPKSILTVMQEKLNEPIFLEYEEDFENIISSLQKNNVCLIGCGIGLSKTSENLVRKVIQSSNIPLVIDADAITIISKNEEIFNNIKAKTVLTPHIAEFSRLCNKSIEEINIDKINTVCDFSKRKNVITVLKGAYSLIVADNGNVYINKTGNSGLAKGGSGDVLAGIIASFIAQGLSEESAAVCAVYYHGLAADNLAKKLSEYGMTPSDLLDELPILFKKFNGS